MSLQDAKLDDIYVDEQGKLWRIVAVCHEPTVSAEEVEGSLVDPSMRMAPNAAAGGVWTGLTSNTARIEKRRLSGGVGGAMWAGWERIWRRSPP